MVLYHGAIGGVCYDITYLVTPIVRYIDLLSGARGGINYIWMSIFLLPICLVGVQASKQTGRVRTGMQAGLVAGLVAGISSEIVELVTGPSPSLGSIGVAVLVFGAIGAVVGMTGGEIGSASPRPLP